MAELTSQERLQPALLDRLTDLSPDNQKPEPRELRMISRQRLRDAVQRDLAWLFNSARPTEEEMNCSAYPHAAHSVLRFGLPPLSGETASTIDIASLEAAMRQAIIDFEPRLDAETLKVQALVNQDVLDHHNQIQVQIRGNLWAQPVPIEMLLRTEVDLESGQVEVKELGA